MTSEQRPETELVRTERILTTCLVLLKLHVLYLQWGKITGFDANPWIDMLRATHWFVKMPDPRALFSGYHMPLSFLIGRWIFAVYPHEVETSQILSTLAVIGTVFALRYTLRTVGILWTLPGLALLYVTASVPVVVWMAIETSYDALVLMWFVTTLAVSVKVFWDPVPAGWWRRVRTAAGPVLLGIVLALGLLTKSSAVVALGVPYLVIVARRGPRALFREWAAPSLAVLLGVVLVAPVYYVHSYAPVGRLFPSNMDWLRANDLQQARAERNAHRWRFLLRILRIPGDPLTGEREPARDSFVHSVWQQLWKRDRGLGDPEQAGLSLAVSDFYIQAMPIPIVVSPLLLVAQWRRIRPVWRQLGVVFFGIFLAFSLAHLYYGWSYPLWDWHPFKAKYMSPAVLWIGYCVVLPFVNRSTVHVDPTWRWYGVAREAVSFLVLLFMFVNHLLPVY
jgi:hypothetical protein